MQVNAYRPAMAAAPRGGSPVYDPSAELAALRAAIAQLAARMDALEGRAPAPAQAPAADWRVDAMQAARRFLSRLSLTPASVISEPAAPAAPPPPITHAIIRQAARAYVAAHPEIRDAMSYEQTAAVAQLRDGVIAALRAQGYRAGRVHDSDGRPYDQVVAFGNPGDAMATPYRVTAGGGRIERAIEAGYSDEQLPWSDAH